jgi:uncharacterized protein
MTSECRTGTEELGSQECLRLLATHPVGRVAVVVNGWPTIFPVAHHVMDFDTIVFRCDDISRFTDGNGGLSMSLEVDGIDDAGQLWTVAVNGVGREVDTMERTRLRGLGLEPPMGAETTHWIRLHPETVTGRRFAWLEWAAR